MLSLILPRKLTALQKILVMSMHEMRATMILLVDEIFMLVMFDLSCLSSEKVVCYVKC